jgi:hypothetical protein
LTASAVASRSRDADWLDARYKDMDRTGLDFPEERLDELQSFDCSALAFAKPKSSTFTVPSSRTLMFAGFRSRWTIPGGFKRVFRH